MSLGGGLNDNMKNEPLDWWRIELSVAIGILDSTEKRHMLKHTWIDTEIEHN